jgi:hypothetical protein
MVSNKWDTVQRIKLPFFIFIIKIYPLVLVNTIAVYNMLNILGGWKMIGDPQVKLSTSEIANLWTTYMNDSLAICVMKHFIQHVEDKQIEEEVRYGLQLSASHIDTISTIFRNENIPLPDGFDVNKDVNLSAPRLYTDTFYLLYLHNMAKIAGNGYTLALANAARLDTRMFFTKSTETSATLYNRTAEVLLSKGLFQRPPQIHIPNEVEYVHKQGYLSGWFGDRRPLNCIEVMNLFFNIQRNEVGKSLIMGFSQVAKAKEVTNYFLRGKQIATKHTEIFGSLLSQSDLPAPMTWDTMPTNSTDETFSDKLMMFHTSALTAASLSHYGTSLGTSPRRDIGLHYNRLMGEVALFAEDGANIMINNQWMEEPPTSVSRVALAKNK